MWPTAGTPINKAVSADFFWSVRYAAINVAAISTSASQPKAARLHFPHAALTGVGKFSGGAGNAVEIMGSHCRALRRLGRSLKTAAQLVARIICHGPGHPF
jgi:hypothetical protein